MARLYPVFDDAQVAASRHIRQAQRLEKQIRLKQYLEPRSPNGPVIQKPRNRRLEKAKELSTEEKEVNASSNVTLALRRTHDMMAAELSRSQFAHDTLNESTTALAQLSETYSTLDTMLSRSRNLLGTLLTSQKSDTWYLETAFYILIGTIAWLIWRRLLYGPTWLLVWFIATPLRMFFKGSVGVLGAMGVIGAQKGGVDIGSGGGAGGETVIHDGGRPQATLSGSAAPSIRVGEQGKTARKRDDATSAENISEQVGRIIDESREVEFDEGTNESAETQANPKKRMWEEEQESAKESERRKDEL